VKNYIIISLNDTFSTSILICFIILKNTIAVFMLFLWKIIKVEISQEVFVK